MIQDSCERRCRVRRGTGFRGLQGIISFLWFYNVWPLKVSLFVLPLMDGHESPCRTEMPLASLWHTAWQLPSQLPAITVISNIGININNAKPAEEQWLLQRASYFLSVLAGWWWEGNGDGKGEMSRGAHESTALPRFNGMYIVSETIGCFGWHPTRLIPVLFNPQETLMVRKAAPPGSPLKPAVSV